MPFTEGNQEIEGHIIANDGAPDLTAVSVESEENPAAVMRPQASNSLNTWIPINSNVKFQDAASFQQMLLEYSRETLDFG